MTVEIPGVEVAIGSDAVVVTSHMPMSVISSAVVRGGLVHARAVINLHVTKDDPCADPEAMLGAFARREGVPGPYVGLLTSAWSADASVGRAAAHGYRTL